MAFDLAGIIAPHYCISCGDIGSVLCEYCKYDITSDPYIKCVVCQNITDGSMNLCKTCDVPYDRAWCVSERTDSIEKLLNGFKFERVKAAHEPLASLLDNTVPVLPSDTVITYVTTVAPHIRERGYDHAYLVARTFAKMRDLSVQHSLKRTHNSRQLGSTRKERIVNAKSAFALNRTLDAVPYLLIDDISTTGATLRYAAECLLSGGASEVWVAIIARQPLEKSSRI